MAHKNSLDSIIDGIDDIFNQDSPIHDRAAITIWVPTEKKEKYESLQGRTRRKFGKKLKEIVIKSIDRVNDEAI